MWSMPAACHYNSLHGGHVTVWLTQCTNTRLKQSIDWYSKWEASLCYAVEWEQASISASLIKCQKVQVSMKQRWDDQSPCLQAKFCFGWLNLCGDININCDATFSSPICVSCYLKHSKHSLFHYWRTMRRSQVSKSAWEISDSSDYSTLIAAYERCGVC